jgi:MFS family permease
LVPATFVTNLGNSFQVTASALLILRQEHSALAVGWLFVAVSVPQVLFSLFFGRLADRFDRRRLCVLADLMSAGCSFALPVWLALGGSPSIAAYVSNFALATILALFMPASNALVRERVQPARLGRFNADFEIATQAGTLLSAAAAGFLVDAYGVRPLFLFNAATFLVSALLTSAIGEKRPAAVPCPPVDPVVRADPQEAPARASAPASPADVPLLRLALLYAVGHVVITLSNTMLVVLVVQAFNKGAGALGLVDAFAGVGIMVAAAAYKMVSDRVGNLPIVVAGYLGCALVIALEPISIVVLMALIPLAGISFGLGRVAARTLLMRSVDESRAGRVFGATNALGLASAATCTAFIAKIADATHIRNGFFSLSALVAVTVVVTAATLRARSSAPAPPAPALVLEATT